MSCGETLSQLDHYPDKPGNIRRESTLIGIAANLMRSPVPIVDLFAGPGGLSEGFSAVSQQSGKAAFDVRLSIEKDETAHLTLALRAFFRACGRKVPDAYYDFIKGDLSREALESRKDTAFEFDCARREAIQAELGKTSSRYIDGLIRSALVDAGTWVLIGGPPCQAYSLAGRSRLRGKDPEAFDKDEKHVLYREYLRVIRKFGPAVFVLENVKGILSSTLVGERIFDRILADLRSPGDGLSYRVKSLVVSKSECELAPSDFVVASEKYGIPQCRHRVILVGVRSDIDSLGRKGRNGSLVLEPAHAPITVGQVLQGMPRIRSMLSRGRDSTQAWQSQLRATVREITAWKHPQRGDVEDMIRQSCHRALRNTGTGSGFIAGAVDQKHGQLRDWLLDHRLGGIIQHKARGHMPSDVSRYLFAASFARVVNSSPRLRDFPEKLMPEHANVGHDTVPFGDRFRVQLANRPSTTVVSHIAKDGHYYIHPDPSQCRSLTVREAARLQTFPDNYFFCGNQTQQYHQVGNAVPPLLAVQIAQIVSRILEEGGA